jgi:hypothetical protein
MGHLGARSCVLMTCPFGAGESACRGTHFTFIVRRPFTPSERFRLLDLLPPTYLSKLHTFLLNLSRRLYSLENLLARV